MRTAKILTAALAALVLGAGAATAQPEAPAWEPPPQAENHCSSQAYYWELVCRARHVVCDLTCAALIFDDLAVVVRG